MPKNKDLQTFYDSVYQRGEKEHYTYFRLKKNELPEEFRAVRDLLPWKGKTVLDVGCGTGDMCALIAEAGAKAVSGIDFSAKAIAEARKKYQHPNIHFFAKDFKDVTETFDHIILLGTLEHMDSPFETIRKCQSMLKKGGSLVITCPNWLNPRGYILQTLQQMFDAPITLADIHYLTPIHFEKWAKKLSMKLDWFTVDHEWGHGEKMIQDFARRLPNVVRDANMAVDQKKIDEFLLWLEQHVVPFKTEEKHTGAVGVYLLQKIT